MFTVSAFAWAVVYSYNPLRAIELAIVMVLRDYLLVGAVVASFLWYALYLHFYNHTD